MTSSSISSRSSPHELGTAAQPDAELAALRLQFAHPADQVVGDDLDVRVGRLGERARGDVLAQVGVRAGDALLQPHLVAAAALDDRVEPLVLQIVDAEASAAVGRDGLRVLGREVHEELLVEERVHERRVAVRVSDEAVDRAGDDVRELSQAGLFS